MIGFKSQVPHSPTAALSMPNTRDVRVSPSFGTSRIGNKSDATSAPHPGRMPRSVGQLGSRFVATSFAPAAIIRVAASTSSRLNVRPSPTTT